MSARQENWQTKKPTIRERTKFMFNNGLFSDVKFVVRKSDGESESKQAISAHKLILSIGSPVFEAMFYGDLAETSDSIELPDCEYDSVLELFRYLYSDEVKFSGSNVMEVLYLAKKYIVPSLAVKCTEYLQAHLDPSNVFNILVSARKYDEDQLVDRCWEMIDKQTSAAVKSEGFAMIERPLLEELVERDTLDIPEVELFKGVVQWAEMQGLRPTNVAYGEENRKIIGERIMKAIRFPTMKQDEFAFVVMDSKILSYDEVSTLIKYFSSKDSFPIEFPVSKRSGPLRKNDRFSIINITKRVENVGALGADTRPDDFHTRFKSRIKKKERKKRNAVAADQCESDDEGDKNDDWSTERCMGKERELEMRPLERKPNGCQYW